MSTMHIRPGHWYINHFTSVVSCPGLRVLFLFYVVFNESLSTGSPLPWVRLLMGILVTYTVRVSLHVHGAPSHSIAHSIALSLRHRNAPRAAGLSQPHNSQSAATSPARPKSSRPPTGG